MEELIKKQEEDILIMLKHCNASFYPNEKSVIKSFLSKVRTETSEFEKDHLRQKLRQALKEVHGGGNGRRLLEQLVDEL